MVKPPWWPEILERKFCAMQYYAISEIELTNFRIAAMLAGAKHEADEVIAAIKGRKISYTKERGHQGGMRDKPAPSLTTTRSHEMNVAGTPATLRRPAPQHSQSKICQHSKTVCSRDGEDCIGIEGACEDWK